jgi:hypothetical protein
MSTPPAGQAGRDTVPMRISIPVWTRLAARREQLRVMYGRRSVSLCEALEDRLERLEFLEARLDECEALLGQRDTHPAERERSE